MSIRIIIWLSPNGYELEEYKLPAGYPIHFFQAGVY